jgi:methionyl-tRNA formyltransferase
VTPLNVVLVAEESAGIQALRKLADSSHRVVAVMSSPESSGTGTATVASAARQLGVRLWPSNLVRDPRLGDRLRGERVDLLLNVHSLYVIDEEVLGAPRVGSFNLHPGPLPEYAGLNAPSWAIYHGERRHAATLHWMAAEIDAGPIAYEAVFEITADDTALSVSAKCVRHGVPLLERLLAAAVEGPGAVPAVEQDLSRRRYFGREVPHGGRVPWSLPARRVVDFVRACDYGPFPSPWGRPIARLDDREIAVRRASLAERPSDAAPGTIGELVETGVMVAAADDWVIVERVQAGGRSADAHEILAPGRRFLMPED